MADLLERHLREEQVSARQDRIPSSPAYRPSVQDRYVPFALPDIGDSEIYEVVDSLRLGWITTGPKVARFERAFAAYLGGGVETVAVNSGTAGLHLGLEALCIGPGDEVIVPVHTFTATAEVVCYLGATPVFVDVEPRTLTIDVDNVAGGHVRAPIFEDLGMVRHPRYPARKTPERVDSRF